MECDFWLIIFLSFNENVRLPGTGPHTLGIISKIAEQDGSSKHNCRAKIQFNMAIADLLFEPVNSKNEIKIFQIIDVNIYVLSYPQRHFIIFDVLTKTY